MTTPLEVRGDGITVRVDTGIDAAVAPISPSPVLPDVSRLPGASIVGVASHADEQVRVVLGCLRAPSDKWVPGLSSVVFERATPMILGAAALRPTLERAATPSLAGASFAEAYRGREGDRAVVVAHRLAFTGPDADVLACSLACSAPGDGARCDAIARSFALEGDLRLEPPPGLLARAVLGAAAHPVLALGIGVVLVAAVVGVLLATRPRLRPVARPRRVRPSPHATPMSRP